MGTWGVKDKPPDSLLDTRGFSLAFAEMLFHAFTGEDIHFCTGMASGG
ncbi:hypothetical protein MWG46_13795 [Escherichia coli]|nr:hypothetical protein [Escherichia coli]